MVVKRPQYIVMGVLLPVLLFSCSGSEKSGSAHENKAVEGDTTQPDTTAIVVEVPDLIEPEPISGRLNGDLFVRSDSFVKHFIATYDTAENRRVLLPERFSSARIKKYSLVRKQGVAINDTVMEIPQARVWLFEYNDTTQLNLIRRNWFYEFGDNRTEIYAGKSTFVKSPPLHIFISDKSIAVLETDCKTYQDFTWQSIRTSFERLFNGPDYLKIQVDCSGNLRW